MDMAPAPPGERRYKGVRLRKWGPWVSEIRLPNSRERIWLGSYDAPEKAARAFDAAYLCLRGPGGAGGLNFPGSPPPNVGRTSDPEEVYAAAVFHANRAAAAAAPRDAGTDQPPVDAAAVVPPAPAPAPLQVPARSSDWAELLLADLPPLFSPTYAESHAYLTAADDDDNMEEIESVSCPGSLEFRS